MAKGSSTLKVYCAAAASASAAATSLIPRSGRIIAIEATATALSGAGVDGRVVFELSRTSVQQIQTNDIYGSALSYIQLAGSVASATCHAENTVQGISIPVQAGDRLYINIAAFGTAFSAGSAICCFMVHIAEN